MTRYLPNTPKLGQPPQNDSRIHLKCLQNDPRMKQGNQRDAKRRHKGARGSEKGTTKVLEGLPHCPKGTQIDSKELPKGAEREPTGVKNDSKMAPKWFPNGMWDRRRQIIKNNVAKYGPKKTSELPRKKT